VAAMLPVATFTVEQIAKFLIALHLASAGRWQAAGIGLHTGQ